MSDDSRLAALNQAEPGQAERDLLACCASRRWADELLARRPYRDLDALRAVSTRVLDALTWDDIEEALAAHPRIGERAAGGDQAAGWSRAEQAGVSESAASTREDLVAGNLAYEERFGHVFLIRATGLSAETILTRLRERLGNDPGTERAVVRAELGGIVELRLGKAFSS
ncbi:2-oxo-4-hydroxy-4-carboxy-5-ureidoimidazoline decarboxylase [Actinophytocola sediminis]